MVTKPHTSQTAKYKTDAFGNSLLPPTGSREADFLHRALTNPSLYRSPQALTKKELRSIAADLRNEHRIPVFVDDDGSHPELPQSDALDNLRSPLAEFSLLDVSSSTTYGDIQDFFADISEISPSVGGSDNINADISKAIESRQSIIASQFADVGLLPAQVVDEIQGFLDKKFDHSVSLIYSGYETNDPHADSFIVVPSGLVLNPISYNERSLHAILDSISSKGITVAIADTKLIGEEFAHPQADRTSCGALALAAMVEYLKSDEHQLASHTLILGRGNGQLSFMLPSPHVLRYSQSSNFNEIIVSFVRNRLLDEATRHPITKYDGSPLHGNELKAFRDSWLAAYQESNAGRDTMWLVDTDLGDVNLSLADMLDRYKEKAMRLSNDSLASAQVGVVTT